jgi:hypothetical protein
MLMKALTVSCDREGCVSGEKVANEHDVPDGWYCVTRVGQAEGPWEFCSSTCLIQWGEARAEAQAEIEEGST